MMKANRYARQALFIFYWIGVFFIPAFSQSIREKELSEFKARLPFLSGIPKVEMLIIISDRYINSSVVRSDTGLFYIKQAYELADSIGYTKGLCRAAGLYGRVLLQKGLADEGLKYYQVRAVLAKKLGDKSQIASAIRGVGQALWFQGNYQQAIDTIFSSILYFEQLKDYREISDARLTISTIYGDQGNYEKAFETAQQALTVSEKYNDRSNTILSLVQLGKLYRSVGDYPTALAYYKKGYSYKPSRLDWTARHLAHNMGDLACDKRRYDSALYYYRESFAGNAGSRMSQLKMGQYYLLVGNDDSAFFYFDLLYRLGDKSGEGNIRYSAMAGLAKIFLRQKDYAKALVFGKEVWQRSVIKNARLSQLDAFELLSVIYDSLKQPQQALNYYRQYVQLKDGIITDKFKGKLYEFKRIAEDEKRLSQIELLKRERLITAQNLRKTQSFRNILAMIVLFIISVGVGAFWTISLKRKNEKLRNESSRAEWQKAATDLEMQALRAQMNPHFIFNCLSSINKFILKNEPDIASDYLTRFSKLIRMVLVNSQKSQITLEDETDMLRLYLEMEQLRFKDKFSYNITYGNDIKTSDIMIPPLLLQPFCENAIWHGLMHKNGPGHLCIHFAAKQQVLQCTITDNGIGRMKAEEIKKGTGESRKSLGLKLTAERLALFNEDSLVSTSWTIDDVRDEEGNIAGTKVMLHIRHKESA
jgi:tetratricopeptide (TPR) repeat protein/anti-sigma regulatory factor (Ser/Thr protein kinase)